MSGRILVVEDEDPIRLGLGDALRFAGHEPTLVADGEAGLAAATSGDHDLLLLDVMLPGVDGFTICRKARSARPQVAICMLTAKGGEDDILEGFRCGADDYIPKPFSVQQLLARIAALLRRAAPGTSARFQAGAVAVDSERLCASCNDKLAELTSRDVAVLACLARSPGRVVPRTELLTEVWGYARIAGVETRCVDMHLVKLRRKLKDGLGNLGADLIETVRGEGYRIGGAGYNSDAPA
ncbi:MAG: response regulator transcription factor [Planctomycetota bacterium]|jgi:DNA-binding response OmpR family regulator|nr:response regulator transcription factor [Planctomycetota bacterium]